MTLVESMVLALTVQATAMLVPGQNHFLIFSHAHQRAIKQFLIVLGIASAGVVFSSGAATAIYLSGEATSDRIFSAIGFGGSLYLLYLGAMGIRRGIRPVQTVGLRRQDNTLSMPGAFAAGFFVNLSNAKSALFFGSIFATTLPLATMTLVGYAVVIVLFFLNSLFIHGMVTCFLATPPMQAVVQRRQNLVALLSGLFFVFFALSSLWYIGLRP